LEHGNGRTRVHPLHGFQGLDQRIVADEMPGDADTLVEPDEVRRGIDMDAPPRRLGDGAEERAGAAFAVGPRDMDYRRQAPLGMTELGKQSLQPFKAKIDQPRVQAMQSLDDAFDAGAGCVSHHRQAASRSLTRSRSITRASISLSSVRLTTMSRMPCSCRYSARWKPSGNFSRTV